MNQKPNFSLYSLFYAEACNELAPRLSVKETQPLFPVNSKATAKGELQTFYSQGHASITQQPRWGAYFLNLSSK